ncbi:MAG TPA: thioesterase family protein [Thermoanaerobaculia bacterium]|jgi:acyl-CoA thioester hydrolase
MRHEPEVSRVVETNLRVRYSETDQMGIVYHAHYLIWFEIGRTEWCRAAGAPYAEMERSGLLIPVTRVECAFRRTSSYDDLIRILTRMRELSSRGCTFAYEIRNPAGDLLADGASRHVFTDPDGRPRRGDATVLRTLESFRGVNRWEAP